MTKDVQDALRILCGCVGLMELDLGAKDPKWMYGYQTLHGAVRHLAYPDRDVYPKTRKGTKGAPIVRR